MTAFVYSSPEDIVGINLLINVTEISKESCSPGSSQTRQGICEFAKTLLNLTVPVANVTALYRIGGQTTSLEVEWEPPSPLVLHYLVCLDQLYDCESYQTETTKTFKELPTGVDLSLTIRTVYPNLNNSEDSTFHIFIPREFSCYFYVGEK